MEAISSLWVIVVWKTDLPVLSLLRIIFFFSVNNKHFSLLNVSTQLWWRSNGDFHTAENEFNWVLLPIWDPASWAHSERGLLKKKEDIREREQAYEIDSHHRGGVCRPNLIKHLLHLQENTPQISHQSWARSPPSSTAGFCTSSSSELLLFLESYEL